jgi:hypothetical protein
VSGVFTSGELLPQKDVELVGLSSGDPHKLVSEGVDVEAFMKAGDTENEVESATSFLETLETGKSQKGERKEEVMMEEEERDEEKGLYPVTVQSLSQEILSEMLESEALLREVRVKGRDNAKWQALQTRAQHHSDSSITAAGTASAHPRSASVLFAPHPPPFCADTTVTNRPRSQGRDTKARDTKLPRGDMVETRNSFAPLTSPPHDVEDGRSPREIVQEIAGRSHQVIEGRRHQEVARKYERRGSKRGGRARSVNGSVRSGVSSTGIVNGRGRTSSVGSAQIKTGEPLSSEEPSSMQQLSVLKPQATWAQLPQREGGGSRGGGVGASSSAGAGAGARCGFGAGVVEGGNHKGKKTAREERRNGG